MDFVPLVVLSALVKKLIDTVKYAAAGDLNAVSTQILTWLSGIAVVAVAAHSDIAQTLAVNGFTLGSLNGWSQVLVGVNLASTASVGWDVIKAVDASNSAVVPNLLSKTGAPQGVVGSNAPTSNDI